MIPINTKEELIYFMQCGMISLSKYDLRFIQNLHLYTAKHNPLTSNQVNLFDKLVEKYKRQLKKHGLAFDKLEKLPWKSEIIPSDPKFTEAFISIENNKITLRSPFNNKFISALSKTQYNTLKWLPDKKIYESNYSTEALKKVVGLTHKFYNKVNYCPVVQDLINKISDYSADYWTPTLVKCNDRFIIAAINDKLAEAIKDIPLSDDPVTLSMLATYGINIDEDITNGDKFLEFASRYITEVDFKDLDIFIDWLKHIDCDCVFMAAQAGMKIHYRKILTDKLKEKGIPVDTRNNMILGVRISEYARPVCVAFSSNFMYHRIFNFAKVVLMRNSLPVDIK